MTHQKSSTSTTTVLKERLPRRLYNKLIVEVRYIPEDVRKGLFVSSAVLVGVGLVAFIVILISVITHTGLSSFDHGLEQWMDARRAADITPFMITLAIVFGPVVLPVLIFLIVAFWVITSRHIWRPLILAGFMSLGVGIVEVTAHFVARPRPPIGLMLMGPDHTFSFPSGHVMGTADFLLLSSFLIVSRKPTKFRIWTASIICFVIIVSQIVSRVYLGYHWFTDTLASVSLALIMLGLLIALDTWRTTRVPGEPITGEMSKKQTQGT